MKNAFDEYSIAFCMNSAIVSFNMLKDYVKQKCYFFYL